jgi:hypothetical protein
MSGTATSILYWSEPATDRRKKHSFMRAPFIVIYVSIGLDNSKLSVYVIDRPYGSSPWRDRERGLSFMVDLATWCTVPSSGLEDHDAFREQLSFETHLCPLGRLHLVSLLANVCLFVRVV